MSATAKHAVPGIWAAPATADFLIAALLIGVFVFVGFVSATRPDITTGFDEPAHISYAAHIQHTGDPWPNLNDMRMIDPQTFTFTAKGNFLDHPPLFYDLLAAIGPRLEGRPQALLPYRLFDVGLVALGLAALLMIGLDPRLPRLEFWAFAMPLAFIPILVQLAAAVTNDDLAFLGGAMATLGAWRAVTTGRGFWLAVALGGVVIAGWAKMTGLVLTGTMVGSVIVYLLWRRRLALRWIAVAAVAFAAAAAPYGIFIVQYGAPVPMTPALTAFVEQGLRDYGWADLPRESLPVYFGYFVSQFIANWMPTAAPRHTFQYAMLVIPVAALVCAAAGIVLSLRRLWRNRETALDIVVIAGALELAANFALHFAYSYKFYAATGWLAGAYPRYYLPLAAIVPLAGLSLAAGVGAGRWRTGLLVFLIAGPVVFRFLGVPPA